MSSTPSPAGSERAVAEPQPAADETAGTVEEAAPAAAGTVVPAPAPIPAPVAVPQDQEGIDALRTEIDGIDAELVRLIQRRSALSHAIGTARKSFGGPRIVYSREMAILERFRPLGPAGTDLAMMLLAMGRGRLGRK